MQGALVELALADRSWPRLRSRETTAVEPECHPIKNGAADQQALHGILVRAITLDYLAQRPGICAGFG